MINDHSVFSQLFVKFFIQLYLLRLGLNKQSCSWKTAEWKICYHSPARIVECVSGYIFFISKNKQAKTKQNKARIEKSKRNERRKNNVSGKSIKKAKFVAARVTIFLVTRISGNKSIFFFGLIVLYCTALDSHILVAPNLIN